MAPLLFRLFFFFLSFFFASGCVSCKILPDLMVRRSRVYIRSVVVWCERILCRLGHPEIPRCRSCAQHRRQRHPTTQTQKVNYEEIIGFMKMEKEERDEVTRRTRYGWLPAPHYRLLGSDDQNMGH
ncbi:hypothetical protein EDD16DRAFT_1000228 [Pisolithus croceorrhizus]|nr:hypothetical protein EDD16DRAFT_1000228 [Pisolithus croceorrhizus]